MALKMKTIEELVRDAAYPYRVFHVEDLAIFLTWEDVISNAETRLARKLTDDELSDLCSLTRSYLEYGNGIQDCLDQAVDDWRENAKQV